MKNILLLLALLISLSFAADTTCALTDIVLTVGVPMEEVVCSGGDSDSLIAKPLLPEGLSIVNNVISGTPVRGQTVQEYLIVPHVRYDSDNLAVIRISIIAEPHSVTYGFETTKVYAGLLMEPLYPYGDSHFTSFTITPSLPLGLSFDEATGIIRGTPTLVSASTVYAVVATNSLGSATTSFSFEVIDQSTMTTPGITGIYYTFSHNALHLDHLFYSTTPAQISLRHDQIQWSDEFQDSHGGHPLYGLDDRFRDFYSAEYIAYFVAPVAGEYIFRLESDDGSRLAIDSFDNFLITLRGGGGGTTEAPITLTEGKHLLYMTYIEINYGAKMYVSYKSEAAGINDFVPVGTGNCFIGGRGPVNLKYPTVVGVVGSPVQVTYPTFTSGHIQSFTTTLPTGLTIDNIYGYISGTVNYPIDADFTVTMIGEFGSSQATVHLRVVNTPEPNMIAKWYKIIDVNSLDTYKDFPELITNLRINRLEDRVYMPDINGDGVLAYNLDPNMWERVYATWEGFLYFDEIGDYTFMGQADDGIKLYIENEMILYQWRIGGIDDKVYGTYHIDKVGYYPFRIKYFEGAYGNGILLSWKKPSVNLMEYVPASAYFHVPITPFTYNQIQYNAFVGQPIPINTPIWTGVTAPSTYSVSPALPEGITLDTTTGLITGTIVNTQNTYTYTITNGDYSTSIKITGLSLTLQSTYYYTIGGNELPEVWEGTVGNFFEMRPISEGRIDSWSCTPEPPRGIYIESYSGWFKGTPLEVQLDATTYTLKGCNNGGCMTATVTLKITGCEFGKTWYTSITKGSGKITIKNGETELNTQEGNTGAYRHCFDTTLTNLIHRFECTSSSGCEYSFYRDDLTYIFSDVSTIQETNAIKETTLNLNIFAPSFTVASTSIAAARSVNITPVLFTILNGYKEVIFTPALPSTAYFDVSTSQLKGNWPYFGTYSYQVYAKNAISQSEIQTITVTVGNCPNNKQYLFLERKTAGWHYEERFTITQNGETYIDVSSNYDNQKIYNSICISSGTFDLNMYDQYSNGWADGSYLSLYEESGRLLGKYRYEGSQPSPVVMHITLSHSIPQNSVWKYNHVAPSEWINNDYTDSTWVTASKGLFPTFTNNVIYLRNVFTVDDPSKYPVLDLAIYFKEGCVIYINGNKVYSQNMPTVVDANTMASSAFSTYIYRRTAVPSYQLITGTNTIAIEVHRSSMLVTEFDFDLIASLLEGECINRIDDISLSNSNSYNMPTESVNQAFDNDVSTKWLEDGMPAYTIISFNNDRKEFINKIQIYSANDHEERDPSAFTLKASNDGIQWVLLLSVNDNNIWTERKQMREWTLKDSLEAYHFFKFEVTASRGSIDRTQVSEIQLYSCLVNYCTNDGEWTSVQTGVTSSMVCPDNQFGKQFRQCSLQNNIPTWNNVDSSACLTSEIPASRAFIDSILSLNNVTYLSYTENGNTNVKNQLYSLFNEDPNYDITVFLPEAVTTVDTFATSVYVRVNTLAANVNHVSDIYNTLTTSLTPLLQTADNTVFTEDMSISYISEPKITYSNLCASDDIWVETPVNTMATSPCDDIANYQGEKTRFCSLTAQWEDVISICAVIPVALVYPTSSITVAQDTVMTTVAPSVLEGGFRNPLTITPDLPDGLVFDQTTGALSGTPTTITPAAVYTITLSNTIGTTSFEITLNVVASFCSAVGDWPVTESGNLASIPCPDVDNYHGSISRYCNSGATPYWGEIVNGCTLNSPTISYPVSSITAYVNVPIDTVVPTITGIELQPLTISTPLPEGFTFDTTTGAISGTATSVMGSINYSIVVSNAGGSQEASITLVVMMTYCQGEGEWPVTPSGETINLSCNDPVLYEGGKTRFCNYGYPAQWNEVVDTCTLRAPTITYSTTSIVGYKGIGITPLSPNVFGGQLSALSISPSLPNGLAFNTQNGLISGTPTVSSALASYTISVSNPTGVATASVSIIINISYCTADGEWSQIEAGQSSTLPCSDATNYEGTRTRSCSIAYPAIWSSVVDSCLLKLPVLTYRSTSITGFKNDTIASVVPTSLSGGLLNPITISPALPDGLTIDTVTGVISGTPSVTHNGNHAITLSNSRSSVTVSFTIFISTIQCPYDGDWTATERGTTAFISCPDGQKGIRSRECLYVAAGSADWNTADETGCYIYNAEETPGEKKIFINVPIVLTGIPSYEFDNAKNTELFRNLIVKQLSAQEIKSEDIRIVSTSSFGDNTIVNIRVHTDDVKESTISTEMSKYCVSSGESGLAYDCKSLSNTELSKVTSSYIEGNGMTVAYEPMATWLLILIIVVVVVVVIVVILIIVCCTCCKKEKSSKIKPVTKTSAAIAATTAATSVPEQKPQPISEVKEEAAIDIPPTNQTTVAPAVVPTPEEMKPTDEPKQQA
ncbi:hypothetical protein WA158_002392 [Blastocystis sp. Blastoise]